jgi:hypothetical protein
MTKRVIISYLCLGLLALWLVVASALMLMVPAEKIESSGQISVYNSKTRLFRTEEKDNYVADQFDVVQGEVGKVIRERNYLFVVFGFLAAGSLSLVGYKDYKKRTLTNRCTGADHGPF